MPRSPADRICLFLVSAGLMALALYGLFFDSRPDPCDPPAAGTGVYCADTRGPNWVMEQERLARSPSP